MEEFYSITPREYHALMDRRKEELHHRELLNGILASQIVNFSMGGVKKPTVPKDFMPSQWEVAEKERKQKKVSTKQQRKQTAASVRGLFEGFRAWQKDRGIVPEG